MVAVRKNLDLVWVWFYKDVAPTALENMDKRITIWNVLHDGEITAVSGENSDTLTMFVSIPYLRRRLEPLGDSFVLTLKGLKRLEFYNFDGTGKRTARDELEIGSPEILSTKSEAMPIRIETTMGYLILDFDSIEFAMDTGQEVKYEAIEKVCQEYWTEWKEKSEQARRDSSLGKK
jgi:hypothetical protein